MTLTTLTYAFGEDTWTEVEITFHRTGPAFIITNIAEGYSQPRVPDHEWEGLEEAANVHVADLVDECMAVESDEDPGAAWLAQINRDNLNAIRRGL